MANIMTIREAAKTSGLSEWELRQGIRTGKYPAMKVGLGAGKYLVDIDLLEAQIKRAMLSNVRSETAEGEKNNIDYSSYGKMRRIL